MSSDAELLVRARSLLWDAHTLIHDALITDSVTLLWDWREGPLTDFLIETDPSAPPFQEESTP